MELHSTHCEKIEAFVEQQIDMPILQTELKDHLYCLIEDKMEAGLDFETAFNESVIQLAPDGINTIEIETLIALTLKFQITMKKLLYSFGYLASFFIIVAFVFRTLHWPGGIALMFVGNACLFVTMFLLMLLAFKNYPQLSASIKLRSLSGALGGFLVAVGNMFKILHYPAANVLFLLGAIVLCTVFLPALFIQLYRKDIASHA